MRAQLNALPVTWESHPYIFGDSFLFGIPHAETQSETPDETP